MNLKTLKPTLFKLHRWIGVALAPLFLLIALSGAVLAFKPMQGESIASDRNSVSTPRLIAFLEQLDPLGQEVNGVAIDATGQKLSIKSQFPDIAGEYDLASHTRVGGTEESESFDLFEFAEHLHKELLIGADIVIQIASYLMLMLVIVAPILAWPKFRHNLTGWHRTIGWLLLPLIIMLPLTGVLMSLHVGMPELPRMSQPGTSLSLSQALLSAQQDQDLSGLTLARRFRGGSVLLKTEQGGSEAMIVVTDNAVTPINPQHNLVKTLHEGTWAAPWSATLNLLGAGALSLLSVTGFISWQRRRRKRRQMQAQRPTDEALA
jgi:sulfite reductase (NADPH) flavoprotein alpha-component